MSATVIVLYGRPLGVIATSPDSRSRALKLPEVIVIRPIADASRAAARTRARRSASRSGPAPDGGGVSGADAGGTSDAVGAGPAPTVRSDRKGRTRRAGISGPPQ